MNEVACLSQSYFFRLLSDGEGKPVLAYAWFLFSKLSSQSERLKNNQGLGKKIESLDSKAHFCIKWKILQQMPEL